MSKLPALTPDDPLRAVTPVPPAQPAAPATTAEETTEAPAPRRRATRRRTPAPAPQPAVPQTSLGEEWTGATDVTTFRLPAEILHALHECSRQLGIAKGMTVAAAVLELLQREDTELVELVERTQQRYDTARRRARRAAPRERR
jgi:hypothetical protein